MEVDSKNKNFFLDCLDKSINVTMANGEIKSGFLYSVDTNFEFFHMAVNQDKEALSEEELIKISYKDIKNFECEFTNSKQYERLESFRTDTHLKEEKNFKDDFETFKKKLIENSNFEVLDKDPATTHSSTTKEKPDFETLEAGNSNHEFDQFELNEKKFNVKSDYDELMYTTEIDFANLTDEKKERADKIEKEILSQKSKNVHLMEDRGFSVGGGNEEDKYSSVHREAHQVNRKKQEIKNNFEKEKTFRSNVHDNEGKGYSWLKYLLLFILVLLIILQVGGLFSSRNDLERPHNTSDDTPEDEYEENPQELQEVDE